MIDKKKVKFSANEGLLTHTAGVIAFQVFLSEQSGQLIEGEL